MGQVSPACKSPNLRRARLEGEGMGQVRIANDFGLTLINSLSTDFGILRTDFDQLSTNFGVLRTDFGR